MSTLLNDPVYLIYYDDQGVEDEIFSGAGAEFAAKKRYEQVLKSWSCTLFVKYQPYTYSTLAPTVAGGYGVANAAVGGSHVSYDLPVACGRCAKCAEGMYGSMWMTQYGTLCDECYREEFVEKPGGC